MVQVSMNKTRDFCWTTLFSSWWVPALFRHRNPSGFSRPVSPSGAIHEGAITLETAEKNSLGYRGAGHVRQDLDVLRACCDGSFAVYVRPFSISLGGMAAHSDEALELCNTRNNRPEVEILSGPCNIFMMQLAKPMLAPELGFLRLSYGNRPRGRTKSARFRNLSENRRSPPRRLVLAVGRTETPRKASGHYHDWRNTRRQSHLTHTTT